MSTGRSNSPPSSSPPTHHRRASLAPGSSLTELFSKSGNSGANAGTQAASPPFPSPITTVAANAQSNHRRRLSITTLGLSGSPSQTSPFGTRIIRPNSMSSSVGSTSPNLEEAVDDSENTPPNTTTAPFARRLSFGAQALREVRGGNTAGAGEGFNWSEALRTRAERAPSFGNFFSTSPQAQQPAAISQGYHQRAASVSIVEEPTREMPKQPRQNKPDFFQEKILRADFMELA